MICDELPPHGAADPRLLPEAAFVTASSIKSEAWLEKVPNSRDASNVGNRDFTETEIRRGGIILRKLLGADAINLRAIRTRL